jgi:hypothetical protein
VLNDVRFSYEVFHTKENENILERKDKKNTNSSNGIQLDNLLFLKALDP